MNNQMDILERLLSATGSIAGIIGLVIVLRDRNREQ